MRLRDLPPSFTARSTKRLRTRPRFLLDHCPRLLETPTRLPRPRILPTIRKHNLASRVLSWSQKTRGRKRATTRLDLATQRDIIQHHNAFASLYYVHTLCHAIPQTRVSCIFSSPSHKTPSSPASHKQASALPPKNALAQKHHRQWTRLHAHWSVWSGGTQDNLWRRRSSEGAIRHAC
jgi:hypothetical protein